MNYISVNDLNINFDKKVIFKDISFNITQGSFISIATPSSKGKTTLLKLIIKNIESDSVIVNEDINKISLIDSNLNFFCNTVTEELLLITKNLNKIKKILKEFNMIDYINVSPFSLSYINMYKLKLIKAILGKNKIILMDNIFCYFDKYSKIEFIGLLKKYQQEKNIK